MTEPYHSQRAARLGNSDDREEQLVNKLGSGNLVYRTNENALVADYGLSEAEIFSDDQGDVLARMFAMERADQRKERAAEVAPLKAEITALRAEVAELRGKLDATLLIIGDGKKKLYVP